MNLLIKHWQGSVEVSAVIVDLSISLFCFVSLHVIWSFLTVFSWWIDHFIIMKCPFLSHLEDRPNSFSWNLLSLTCIPALFCLHIFPSNYLNLSVFMLVMPLFWQGQGKRVHNWALLVYLQKCVFFFFLRFYLFLEGKGGGEGQKHQCVVASPASHTGDLACNPGTCPEWESN